MAYAQSGDAATIMAIIASPPGRAEASIFRGLSVPSKGSASRLLNTTFTPATRSLALAVPSVSRAVQTHSPTMALLPLFMATAPASKVRAASASTRAIRRLDLAALGALNAAGLVLGQAAATVAVVMAATEPVQVMAIRQTECQSGASLSPALTYGCWTGR